MTPYRAIVGVETLGLSNAAFGLVMALNALGGSAIAVLLGWLSDKVKDRRLLVLLCAIGGGGNTNGRRRVSMANSTASEGKTAHSAALQTG